MYIVLRQGSPRPGASTSSLRFVAFWKTSPSLDQAGFGLSTTSKSKRMFHLGIWGMGTGTGLGPFPTRGCPCHEPHVLVQEVLPAS